MQASHKLQNLEGLRGVAAFIVVVSHLRYTFYSSSSKSILSALDWLPYLPARTILALVEGLYNGTFAVWLFWILSAFVLSLQFFLRAKNNQGPSSHDYLEDATLRRYPRLLLPVMASVVFAYTIHSNGMMHNAELSLILDESRESGWLSEWYRFPASLPHAIESSLWSSFFDYDQRTSYNAVLWSMEKELYGSLFLFAFLAIFGNRKSRVYVYPASMLAIYLLNAHWLNAFICGIALCDMHINGKNAFASIRRHILPGVNVGRYSGGLTLIAWLLILISIGLGNRGNVSYTITGTIAVVLALYTPHTVRFMSGSVPVYLGKISFGLYLVHLPIICSYSCWAYITTYTYLGKSVATLLASTTTCVLSIFAGHILYILADRPALKLSRRLSLHLMRTSHNS